MHSFGANLHFFWDRAKALAPGKYYKRAFVGGNADLNFQWHSYGAGEAEIKIWSTNLSERRDVSDSTPATAPAVWVDESPYGATFLTVPTGTPGSDRLDVAVPGWANILVELTVTVELEEFSLTVRGQTRAG